MYIIYGINVENMGILENFNLFLNKSGTKWFKVGNNL